jgi:hypothetical protein
MPIDTTPSTVATNALQALPFNSLIGGPLKACVEAQAMAAQTTWKFIQEVGLNPPDNKGNRSATQVVFQYQKGGQMVNLVVPLLAIVPIPYIAIDEINIGFKANISASASSVSEQAESSSVGAEAGGSVKGGWGPFSAEASFKANYSSKKDSKASQESKYSVEYTMDIQVHAKQADMPAGLTAVLGMLQQAITETEPGGKLEVSPSRGALDASAQGSGQEFLAVVTNGMGLLAKDSEVTFTLDGAADAFAVDVVKGTRGGDWSGGKITVKTDRSGQAAIRLSVSKPEGAKASKLTVASRAGQEQLSRDVALQVVNVPSSLPAEKADKTNAEAKPSPDPKPGTK